MIDLKRLADTFKTLVEIDSVSKNEARVSKKIQMILESLGADVMIDGAAGHTGSDTGNIIARIPGTVDVPPMMWNAHMDTVGPGDGIKAVLEEGVFTSQGDTILGADDKSAVAIIIELLYILKENRLPHGPLEVVLTTCEEVGLLGAKHLDFELISSKFGFALDASDIEGIVTRAPAANKFIIKVHGKDAHAGTAPEEGINAIWLAGKAIGGIEVGKLDSETSCNIGMIEGGIATNIIPSLAVVKGEVRSHNEDKLKKITRSIVDSFEDTIRAYKENRPDDDLPYVEIDVQNDFSGTHIPDDHHVVRLAMAAAGEIGMSMKCKTTGGGADANIFFSKGIVTGVLGTGMKDIHTVRESIKLDDMVRMTELVLKIVQLHAESG